MPLVEAWFHGLGAVTSIDQTPGLVCNNESLNDGLSLLLICAVFGWDCWAINRRACRAVHVSHDDWCKAGSVDPNATDYSWIQATDAELRI